MSTKPNKTLLYEQLTSRFGGHATLKDLLTRVRLRSLPVGVRGPKSGFVSYILARSYNDSHHPHLIVVPNESEVVALQADLALFGIDAIVFPSWGTGAYASPSDNAGVWGTRMRALSELSSGHARVVIAPVRAIAFTSYRPGPVPRVDRNGAAGGDGRPDRVNESDCPHWVTGASHG